MRNWLSGGLCVLIVALCGLAFAQQSFYSIHVSSHRKQAEAGAEVQQLQSKGLDAFMRHVPVKGKGMWYRVFIGKYAAKTEASDQIERLKKMKVSDYFAVTRLSGEVAERPAASAAKSAKPPTAGKSGSAAAPSSNHYLFVGFYRDLDSARAEASRLNAALKPYGNEAFLTQEKAPDGINYRVYIGTYADKPQAAAAGAELKAKNLIPSFYVPVPTTQDMLTGRLPAAASQKPLMPAGNVAGTEATSPKATAGEKPKSATEGRAAKTAARKKPTTAGSPNRSRYTLMLKGGAFSPQNVDDFSVTDATTTYRISEDAAAQIGIEGSLRFNEHFGLYLNADMVLIDDVDWYTVSAGPMLTFQASELVMPYLKGGAVFGGFSWDAPGDFDSAFGWEIGTGLNFNETRFKFGVEFAYRDISFDFDDPSVTASESSLDLSGFSMLATFSYWF